MSNKLSEFETIALGSNGNNTNNIDRSDRVNSLPRTSQYVTAVPTEKVKHGILNSLCDSQIKLNIANPSSGFKEKMTLASEYKYMQMINETIQTFNIMFSKFINQ